MTTPDDSAATATTVPTEAQDERPPILSPEEAKTQLKRIVSAPLETVKGSGPELQRVKPIHDGMIDLIIARGGNISRNELAQITGYTPAWVGRVMNSDAFQARLAVRKADLIDPHITMTIEEKFHALIHESLDVLQEKLEKTRDTGTALKTLEIGAKAAGYGARQQNVQLQQNFVVAMPTKATSSGEWAALHGTAQVIDVSTQTLDERVASLKG